MKKMSQEELKQMQEDRREYAKRPQSSFIEALVFVLIVGILSVGAFYGATNCEMNCEVRR